MFKQISWKQVFIGAFITILLTIFIQKIIFNVGLISRDNTTMDFISWVIIYLSIATIALIIAHVSQNMKGIYRGCLYIIAIAVILFLTFVMAFSYKTHKVNAYETVLSMMTEKDTAEVTTLLNEQEKFIFLLTSKDCPYCIELLPTISEKVSESNTMPIYYVKREKDTDSILEELLEAETIPFLVKIENGEIIQNYFDNPINFFE